MGSIEILNYPNTPEILAEGSGSQVPPGIRIGSGTEGGGNGGDIPPAFRNAFGEGGWRKIPTDQEIDVDLFLAYNQELEREIYEQTDDPYLLRYIEESGIADRIMNEPVEPLPEDDKRLKAFMNKVKQAGLIRRSFRERVGDLNPFRRKSFVF